MATTTDITTCHPGALRIYHRGRYHCSQCDPSYRACAHGVLPVASGYKTLFSGVAWSWSRDCEQCRSAAQADRERGERLRAEREERAREAAEAAEAARRQREELIAARLRPGERAIVARFSSRCSICEQRIREGSRIAHNPQQRTARHLPECPPRSETFCCRWCGTTGIAGSFALGGYLCPMSPDGEQPHRP